MQQALPALPLFPYTRIPITYPPGPLYPHHQGFLAEGLQRTGAGLGSVIIDSQPLTVALLAALLFGERLSALGVLGKWGLSLWGLRVREGLLSGHRALCCCCCC